MFALLIAAGVSALHSDARTAAHLRSSEEPDQEMADEITTESKQSMESIKSDMETTQASIDGKIESAGKSHTQQSEELAAVQTLIDALKTKIPETEKGMADSMEQFTEALLTVNTDKATAKEGYAALQALIKGSATEGQALMDKSETDNFATLDGDESELGADLDGVISEMDTDEETQYEDMRSNIDEQIHNNDQGMTDLETTGKATLGDLDIKVKENEESAKTTTKDSEDTDADTTRDVQEGFKAIAKNMVGATDAAMGNLQKLETKNIGAAEKDVNLKTELWDDEWRGTVEKDDTEIHKNLGDIQRTSMEADAANGKAMAKSMDGPKKQERTLVGAAKNADSMVTEVNRLASVIKEGSAATKTAVPGMIEAKNAEYKNIGKEESDAVRDTISTSYEKLSSEGKSDEQQLLNKGTAEFDRMTKGLTGGLDKLGTTRQKEVVAMRDATDKTRLENEGFEQEQANSVEGIGTMQNEFKTVENDVFTTKGKIKKETVTAASELKTEQKGQQGIQDGNKKTLEDELANEAGSNGGQNDISKIAMNALDGVASGLRTDLSSEVKLMQSNAEDLKNPMRREQTKLTAESAKIGGKMGFGSGSSGASLYSTITADDKTEVGNLGDTAASNTERLAKRLKATDHLQSAAKEHLESAIALASSAERARLETAANKFIAMMTPGINNGAIAFGDQFDKLNRRVSGSMEKSDYEAADFAKSGALVGERISDLDSRIAMFMAAQRVQEAYSKKMINLYGENAVRAYAENRNMTLGAAREELHNEEAALAMKKQATYEQMRSDAFAHLQSAEHASKGTITELQRSLIDAIGKDEAGQLYRSKAIGEFTDKYSQKMTGAKQSFQQVSADMQGLAGSILQSADDTASKERKALMLLQEGGDATFFKMKSDLYEKVDGIGKGSVQQIRNYVQSYDGNFAALGLARNASVDEVMAAMKVELGYGEKITDDVHSKQNAQEIGYQSSKKGWDSVSADLKSQISLAIRAREMFEEQEDDELNQLGDDDSMAAKVVASSATTLEENAEQMGEQASGEISVAGDKLTSQTKVAKVQTEASMQEIAASLSIGLSRQKDSNRGLLEAEGRMQALIAGTEYKNNEGINKTRAEMAKNRALLAVEIESLPDNIRYLSKYSTDTAVTALHLLNKLLLVAHHSTDKSRDRIYQLNRVANSFKQKTEAVTGSEVFQTLRRIADADDMAVQAGIGIDDVAGFMEDFIQGAVPYRTEVKKDLTKAEEINELEQHEVDALEIAHNKRQNELSEAARTKMAKFVEGAIGGEDMLADFQSTLATNVDSFTRLGKRANDAATVQENSFMANLKAMADKGNYHLDKAAAEMAATAEDNHGSKQTLYQMDADINNIAKYKKKLLMEQQERLQMRSKKFSEDLMFGSLGGSDGNEQQEGTNSGWHTAAMSRENHADAEHIEKHPTDPNHAATNHHEASIEKAGNDAFNSFAEVGGNADGNADGNAETNADGTPKARQKLKDLEEASKRHEQHLHDALEKVKEVHRGNRNRRGSAAVDAAPHEPEEEEEEKSTAQSEAQLQDTPEDEPNRFHGQHIPGADAAEPASLAEESASLTEEPASLAEKVQMEMRMVEGSEEEEREKDEKLTQRVVGIMDDSVWGNKVAQLEKKHEALEKRHNHAEGIIQSLMTKFAGVFT